jgi:hypothetical protein
MTLAMPSLLLIMFILQLFLHIINTVGATTIDELVRLLPSKTLVRQCKRGHTLTGDI